MLMKAVGSVVVYGFALYGVFKFLDRSKGAPVDSATPGSECGSQAK